jgi:acetyltransferase
VKGGLSEEGKKAALSHTGSLAGTKEVYYGIFEQINMIKADNLEEMFYVASVLENPVSIKGNRIQIITNGGGYGIVSTDAISESRNLKFAELSEKTQKTLKKTMPDYVHIRNPLDISGDATSQRYKDALTNILSDKNVDIILLVALYQTPLITEDITNIISKAKAGTKKPIIVVSTGSDFTEKLSQKLEEHNIPVFMFPHSAITAIDRIVGYIKKR